MEIYSGASEWFSFAICIALANRPTAACVQPQKDLILTKQQVEQLNSQLALLRSQFEEKTTEQQDLKQKADLMERRLVAASRLIAGLGR